MIDIQETAKDIAERLVKTGKYHSIEVCQQRRNKCHPFFVWMELNGNEAIWEKVGEGEYRVFSCGYETKREMQLLLPHMFTRHYDAVFDTNMTKTIGFKGKVEEGYAYSAKDYFGGDFFTYVANLSTKK